MSTENAKQPAFGFGFKEEYFANDSIGWQKRDNHFTGLTKREYFAAMAMQGLVTATRNADYHLNETAIAMLSTQLADALLTQLSKP